MTLRILKSCIIKIWSGLIPAVITPIHIAVLYFYWGKFSRTVDKRYCSCSCWDTVYKGTYESGIAAYKHIYFNATSNSAKIWILSVFCILLLYETCKYLLRLMFDCQLRWSMLVLFISSMFAHYYSWWVYFNYWNDDYYSQWYHQLFFTMTEVISTIVVVILANKKTKVTPRKCFTIVGIALIHVSAGGWDQFWVNVVGQKGYIHQIVRDIGFMFPDLLHVVLPLMELCLCRPHHTCYYVFKSDIQRDFMFMLILVVAGFLICLSL